MLVEKERGGGGGGGGVCVWFERIESKNKGLKGVGTKFSEAKIFLILEMPMVYVLNDRKIIYNA